MKDGATVLTESLADPSVCAAAAQWLRASAATLAPVGGALAGLAAALLLLARGGASPLSAAGVAALWAVLLLMPLERVLALRVRFDAGLFAGLADGTVLRADRLDGLDHALQALGLRAATAAVRPLADRVRGARTLVVKHAAVVALQAGATLVALASAGVR